MTQTNTKYIISIHDPDGNIEYTTNPFNLETTAALVQMYLATIKNYGENYYITINQTEGN